MQPLLIRLELGQYQKLKEYSKETQRSMSGSCRYALDKLFKNENQN